MPATPRFVVQAFADDRDPMLAAWLRFRDAVVDGHAEAPARFAVPASLPRPLEDPPMDAEEPPRVAVWRLLARNNRELARSARCYASAGDAVAHLSALRANLAALRLVRISGGTGTRTSRHGWYLGLGPVPVLTCGRWYPAASALAEPVEATLQALASAPVEAQATILTGSRRRAALR